MAVSSPPSGTNGTENIGLDTPSAQNATSTVPDQIKQTSIAANQDDSEKTKIVQASPGV